MAADARAVRAHRGAADADDRSRPLADLPHHAPPAARAAAAHVLGGAYAWPGAPRREHLDHLDARLGLPRRGERAAVPALPAAAAGAIFPHHGCDHARLSDGALSPGAVQPCARGRNGRRHRVRGDAARVCDLHHALSNLHGGLRRVCRGADLPRLDVSLVDRGAVWCRGDFRPPGVSRRRAARPPCRAPVL